MEVNTNIIEFDQYCGTCKHKDLDEKCDPCNECLDNPALVDTQIPLHYEKEEKQKKNDK